MGTDAGALLEELQPDGYGFYEIHKQGLPPMEPADLLAAQGSEDTQERVLKSLLSDDYSKWKNAAIRPTAALIALPERFNLQESWERGLRLNASDLNRRVGRKCRSGVGGIQEEQERLPYLASRRPGRTWRSLGTH